MVNRKLIMSMPNIIEESDEPVNLSFGLLAHSWRELMKTRFNTNGWLEGVNRTWQEGKTTIIALDEISDVENMDLAFAGKNDYMRIPVHSRLGGFEVWIPFSRDHFRVWRYKREGSAIYLKGSGTYDYGFRIYDILVEDKYTNAEEIHTILLATIDRSRSRKRAIENLNRIEIGHIVTECNRTRVNTSLQWFQHTQTIRKTSERILEPTGKKIWWDGKMDICYL